MVSRISEGFTVAEAITIVGVPDVESSIGRVDRDGRGMREIEASVGDCWLSLSLRCRPFETEITYHSGETGDIIGGLHDPLGGASILLQPVTDNYDQNFAGFDSYGPKHSPGIASFRFLYRNSGGSAIGARFCVCIHLEDGDRKRRDASSP